MSRTFLPVDQEDHQPIEPCHDPGTGFVIVAVVAALLVIGLYGVEAYCFGWVFVVGTIATAPLLWAICILLTVFGRS